MSTDEHQVNVTYAAPADGGNAQLPEGTQEMIASYQVTGVADFAKKMEEEGELIVLARQLLLPCRVGQQYVQILA